MRLSPRKIVTSFCSQFIDKSELILKSSTVESKELLLENSCCNLRILDSITDSMLTPTWTNIIPEPAQEKECNEIKC